MKYGNMKTAAAEVIAIAGMIVLLFLAPQGMAQERGIKATPDYHDFGTIKEGDPAEITVAIQNIGSEPVKIVNVQTS